MIIFNLTIKMKMIIIKKSFLKLFIFSLLQISVYHQKTIYYIEYIGNMEPIGERVINKPIEVEILKTKTKDKVFNLFYLEFK
jgi:hypothetical protein